MRRLFLALCLTPCFLFAASFAVAEPVKTGSALRTLAVRVPEKFLGIPYRADGTLNDAGRFATFNAPDAVFASPGLNCSGLALAVAREVLRAPIPLKDAVRDRLGDSGPGSPLGRDWDFGFDLIMNIADGRPHQLLLPEGSTAPAAVTGLTAPGFDLHDPGFAQDLLPRVQEGFFYITSFSKHDSPQSPARLHYHVGLLVREGDAVWAYGTTRESRKVIRLNLTDPSGLAAFRHSFRNGKNSFKRLTVIEITPEVPPLPYQ